MASAILGSPSLNQAPSPTTPESVPSNEVAMKYAQLLAIATDLLQIETDLVRKTTLVENVAFYDRAVRDAINSTSSGGAPAPNIPSPPPQGPMMGSPPAAMGAPAPGAPPSPPSPGAGMPGMQGVPQ